MDKAMAVRELVEPALTAKGIDVFDVEFVTGRLLVTVDRPGGIDLEALTEANHIVSDLLYEHDPIPEDHYLLEVSSPGLERTLRTPDHFSGAIGETVSIKVKPDVEGERRHQGLLEAADAEGVTVGGRRFSYGDIEKARTVFMWGPTPKKTIKKTTNAKAGS
jgi:ribosome maturation factor RimP